MCGEPKLSDEELGLILQLLEREQNDLPSEIHHTDSSLVRAELQGRLELVRKMLERLHHPMAV